MHIFSPHTGEVLRPPMLPPWSTDYQGEGVLNGIGVFHDTIWLASGHAKILALPKEAAAKPAAKPPSESS